MTRPLRILAVSVLSAALCAAVVGSVSAKPGPPAKSKASLSITPSVDFSFCCTQPQSKTFIVTNNGDAATGVLSVTLTFLHEHNRGEAFAVTNDRCTGRSLGPRKQCSIEVTWLAGPDTAADLTVAGKRGAATASIFGSILAS